MNAKKLPADPEQTNADRAAWAASALRQFQCVTGTDYDDVLSDLLCDLMHWCDRNDSDFQTQLERAANHYKAETADSPDVAALVVINAKLIEALEAQAMADADPEASERKGYFEHARELRKQALAKAGRHSW